MHQAGYKVIGIGEWDGGLYNSKGIDIAALTEYRQKEGTIHGFKGAERGGHGRAADHRLRHAGAGRHRERHHLAERRQGEGEDPGGRRERPHDAQRPTTSSPTSTCS